jgi:head-tail adaptor
MQKIFELRRKNRLMRAGQVEAAVLSGRIGQNMTRNSKSQLNKIDSKVNVKEMWAAVRKLTGRRQEPADVV